MDVRKTVARYYAEWVDDKGASWTECMTKALEDQAETHALELRAYEATVANLEERIRQLEVERCGMALVPRKLLGKFQELNTCNYSHDDVDELNSWGIEILLASSRARCHLCNYQHGHQIGCENNPVDIALLAPAPKEDRAMTDKMMEGFGKWLVQRRLGRLVDFDGHLIDCTAVFWEAWQAAQAVPVVGEPVAYGVPNSRPTESLPFMQVMLQIPENAQYPELLVPLIVKPTHSIPATELATLRERAAMAEAAQEEKAKFAFTCANLRARLEQAGKERDELRKDAERLQKDAERMQKALSEIAEWTDRYTSPGHPIGTVARAAMQERQS